MVKAAFTVVVGPRGYADIKLGISALAPTGTYLTLSPSSNSYEQSWEIGDHRIDKDQNGEAVARVVNHSDQRAIITMGTAIGQINVLRIRLNPKKAKKSGMSDKSLMKLGLPKSSRRRTITNRKSMLS